LLDTTTFVDDVTPRVLQDYINTRTMVVVTAIQPDVVVGHSGFGSTLYLREINRRCP
jgi:hypothetical protein